MEKQFEKFTDSFAVRHIGPNETEQAEMLRELGVSSLDELVSKTVPAVIRTKSLAIGEGLTEAALLSELSEMAAKNDVCRSYIGIGYSNCITPPVVQRNIMENPGWYTQYTPYQAEIAQGRLEALLNFQTLVTDLTALPITNASLLDEGTAAAEAMMMSFRAKGSASKNKFFISKNCHPQTIDVVRTRAIPLGVNCTIGDEKEFRFSAEYFGGFVQYPDTNGEVRDYKNFCTDAHTHEALATVAADILSLTLLTPPGEFGADIAVGTTQRFGVPLLFGGPHAAFLTTKDEYKRQIPGRIVGVSKDTSGKRALRLALQAREQHIRREKATSNICTAQVLLAVMASMYAVYHGPAGVKRIASRVHYLTRTLKDGLERLGFEVTAHSFFDTIQVAVSVEERKHVLMRAKKAKINLRTDLAGVLGISLDEVTTLSDLTDILVLFSEKDSLSFDVSEFFDRVVRGGLTIPAAQQRKSSYLTNPVFSQYHSEHELLRYIRRLESRDLSLTTSMIPLGSCTMKLNAAAEMYPVSLPGFSKIHPFAPQEQISGYRELCTKLEAMLCEVTGFDAVSLQPNAGSAGEYAGLLAIRAFHESNGQSKRHICLIPQSAHGTNPASAAMVEMEVVPVRCDEKGNIDVDDLRAKANEHAESLAALMITYPSTHGVFEEQVKDICKIVHDNGGQVYMDGANMNAQVGLCKPAEIGADVCHLNLHKTFCIPHGGGGPGVGPIGVRTHLTSFLPGHWHLNAGREDAIGPVSSAPWGSAGILPIPYAYIRMMGSQGLTRATQVAILNANYMAKKLEGYFPVVYRGANAMVAHECIVDLRGLKKSANIEVEDVAKRLIDFGFHAPTVSWPVIGTMMIEPTESESKAELDRFCEALICIYNEAEAIAKGTLHAENNPLKNAPHTAEVVLSDSWDRPYSREQAAFPVPRLREHKFWPAVGRVDGAYGDRNLICTCN